MDGISIRQYFCMSLVQPCEMRVIKDDLSIRQPQILLLREDWDDQTASIIMLELNPNYVGFCSLCWVWQKHNVQEGCRTNICEWQTGHIQDILFGFFNCIDFWINYCMHGKFIYNCKCRVCHTQPLDFNIRRNCFCNFSSDELFFFHLIYTFDSFREYIIVYGNSSFMSHEYFRFK